MGGRTAGWHSYTQSAMPIYEYRCDNGHTFEVMQSMTEDPVAVCQTCEAPVQRVFHPVAVHFKGSGFYSTDYGRGATKKEGASKDGAGADSGADTSKEKKPAEAAKPAEKSSPS